MFPRSFFTLHLDFEKAHLAFQLSNFVGRNQQARDLPRSLHLKSIEKYHRK